MKSFTLKITLIAILLCVAKRIEAQMPNVVIDSVRFNSGFNYLEEPCIAMDFKNPTRLIVACNPPFVYTGQKPGNMFYSTDGGHNWTSDTVTTTINDNGDPVVFTDTNGYFYFLHMGSSEKALVCHRSDNITTHTWTNGSIAGSDTPHTDDKPWATVDRRNNQIYLTWSRYDKFGGTNPLDSTLIFFSKSTDTGHSWITPTCISRTPGDCSIWSNSVEGAMPCAGPHSEIYVAWAHNNAILFNRSYDGGATWLNTESTVSNSPGGWYYDNIAGIFRSPGLPFISCDNSFGPYRGTIYVNWNDQRNGVGNTDIWICKSTDSGNTWSSPIKVNNDPGPAEQFMSSMTVDPITGRIYVLFYDRRNYAAGDSLTDVYMAVSKDGASTFQNFKISTQPFKPQKKVFFGDYTCVTAYNNHVHPVWATQESIAAYQCDSKLMTAIIDSSITGASVAPINEYAYNLRVYPNPFSGQTSIVYDLPAAEPVTLYITDMIGKRMAVIHDNELMRPYRHTEVFDANKFGMAPGIYYLCLRSNAYLQVVKMVVAR